MYLGYGIKGIVWELQTLWILARVVMDANGLCRVLDRSIHVSVIIGLCVASFVVMEPLPNTWFPGMVLGVLA